ncbi:ABC transporter ATP-binding protein/permease [Propionivibrio dicarboxylicus]|uniref:Putative ATP-binding cassette transporter n=1 Tax=Propionivibrio dicarboxylicus TaxID=83767 RepID=A0A1G8EX33_9RHOO|nr:ABC transporter ATP-binding protein/permease [Propionivibrio dicarboxylicus]SDH74414.1 putative ATP-binding cassette transporter [Propionivibrio dicarboxylicus]
MEWNHELIASTIWLARSFLLSLAGIVLAIAWLGRFTEWGRQFKRITAGFFLSSNGVVPLAWLAGIVFMTLFSVRMNILFSYWYNGFYNAMQNLDAQAFWRMLAIFVALAAVHVARALADFFLRQAFLVRWRTWLTRTLIDRWLDRQAYYRSRFVSAEADNPDQRIQQDVESFVGNTLSLSMGLLDAVVSLLAFTLILWNLSGTLAILGHEIPRAMVFAVYLYVLVATLFAVRIGRPLIRLNFLNEQFVANFRYALVRLREYAESIAFYGGETVEKDGLFRRFAAVITNVWEIIFRSLKFQGFNLAISQAAVVFPFVVQAPRMFAKQITLGDVMQTAQSFGQVESALSFIRNSYDSFTALRAVINRLGGFLDAADATARLPQLHTDVDETRLAVDALTVSSPVGQRLISQLQFDLRRGASLLIRGRSGIGKTTLLRALAGLWPYVEGKVALPTGGHALFLPQKPYLPVGTLREALHYPCQASDRADVEAVLHACQLAHLVPLLDVQDDWSNRLSLGEQQRLAIGRVLLNRPVLLFLDEASSALDEGLEFAMYDVLSRALPDSILVSVGHRSSLSRFHRHVLDILEEGQWELCANMLDNAPSNIEKT